MWYGPYNKINKTPTIRRRLMGVRLATVRRKSRLLTERHLQQKRAQGQGTISRDQFGVG